MGTCFWILVWEGWGCGLTMLNPRLHTVYDKEKMITHNSFTPIREDETENEIRRRMTAQLNAQYGAHWKIIMR